MGSSVLLAIIILYFFTNTINGKESEEEIKREEFEIPLLAKIVPNVVNPTESLRPPEFSAVIYKDNELLGSGAILNKHYFITLCSLLKGDDVAPSLKIVRPIFNASHEQTHTASISVSHVKLHPDCGDKVPSPARNLGLVRTKETMENVRYPLIPTIHIPPKDTKFLISTYRVDNHAATTEATSFWYIITRQVENSMCAILFQADNANYNMEGNLCMAYYHLGGAHSCKADIGSPLSIRYKDEDTIVGINLHKHDCGHPRAAASFVCIRTNRDWIRKVINS